MKFLADQDPGANERVGGGKRRDATVPTSGHCLARYMVLPQLTYTNGREEISLLPSLIPAAKV